MRLIAVLFLILSTQVLSQKNHYLVKTGYKRAPSSVTKSPIKLAKYLTESDSSEFQKAINIYTWIANNIKYDVKALKKTKPKIYSPKQTLRRKRGICYQYSALFAALCQNSGISSKEIIGYSRGFSYFENGRFFESDHSWNGVKLDSTWYLVDPTWGSGHVQPQNRWLQKILFRWFNKPYLNDKYKFIQQPNYKYFLIKPKSLIEDHLPADPNWQLLEYPISLASFESTQWEFYSSEIDSLYRERIDSIQYMKKLNKYEFLSDIQYLKLTAGQSYSYNPRNTKLMGISSYSIARSYENTSKNLDQRLEASQQATQCYKQAISHLKRHQKTATSESNKAASVSKKQILNQLAKPISERIIKNNREKKISEKFITKEERVLTSHKNQIEKFHSIVSRGFRSFAHPTPSRNKRPELVEKNQMKIESILTEINIQRDSVLILIANFDENKENKKQIQGEIVIQYRKLPPHLANTRNAINQNLRLSQLSKSMKPIDSIGQIIDSLNTKKRDIDFKIRQEKNTLRQLQTSLISLASQTQKLIFQNCQFSGNTVCESSTYNSLNRSISRAYITKLRLEEKYLAMAEYDGQVQKELNEITSSVQQALETNRKFILLFQEKRLGAIYFKLARSRFETDQLIKESLKRQKKLIPKITKLKNELRRSERI